MAKHKHFQLGVKALIENKKGEILLLQKAPKETEKFGDPIYWDLPGGRVEEGLTVQETLAKELQEEIGIFEFDQKELFYALVSNIEITSENCGLILFVYQCTIDENARFTLSDEHTDTKWFSPREAAELLQVKYPIEFTSKVYN